MGGGSWDSGSFASYSKSKGLALDADGSLKKGYSTNQIYRANQLSQELDPNGVIRECCDSKEHPNTIPVILALDVTGSMGDAAVQVASKLNVVMTSLYKKVKDIEFAIMGIGDLECDSSPVQGSQFESDIRIAKWLDKIYFEGGGGGNSYESYTAAWYFGSRHTKLDCWKRGKKGIIITIGDEPLNPILLQDEVENVFGDKLQDDIDTEDLYKEASKKFDIYHIFVDHGGYEYDEVKDSYENAGFVKNKTLFKCTVNGIPNLISDIITNHESNSTSDVVDSSDNSTKIDTNGLISW